MNITQCATLACLLEATAPKPGNVHRGADFEDLTFPDFVTSAVAIGPAIAAAAEIGVGQAALNAVLATRQSVGSNTNLGTVLLLAPLAAVASDHRLAAGIQQVLSTLDAADARNTYEAIRAANAGGLGEVTVNDVSGDAPTCLLGAMRDAAERDLVARQYTNGYREVFNQVVPWIIEGRQLGNTLTDAILHVHIRLMAHHPDSLIARKCGQATAEQAARKAAAVLGSGQPGETGYLRALSDLDFWLRSDHHRRNPGTTADLIAAGLFVILRDRLVEPPFR